MKKIVILMLTICMAVLFAACGGASTDAGDAGDAEDSQAQAEQASQAEEQETQMDTKQAKLLYMGHGSVRITTAEDKVIYVDPFVGDGYEPAADLILSTHGHYDHTAFDKIANRNEDCQTITWKEALEGGEHQNFDLGYAKVEAVEAGYNKNHNVKECVGYIITLSDGVKVYLSGDTSTTEQMPALAEQNIDYAFFCCDGIYNMDMDEAIACAKTVNARHSVPYHMAPGQLFDAKRAERFDVPGKLVIPAGTEIELE